LGGKRNETRDQTHPRSKEERFVLFKGSYLPKETSMIPGQGGRGDHRVEKKKKPREDRSRRRGGKGRGEFGEFIDVDGRGKTEQEKKKKKVGQLRGES